MDKLKTQDNVNPQPTGSRTATPSKKTYSAKELAEIYSNARPDFLGLDMEEVTREWNLDFIYDFLYIIRDEQSISSAIEWIIEIWKEKHGVLDSYTNASNIELIQLKDKFCADMNYIQESLHNRYEDERRKEELRQKMLTGYIASTQTHQPEEVVVEEDSSTDKPVFQQTQTLEAPKYHVSIKDLPNNVQSKVLVSQGVMDVLVKQLNEDTWTIVEECKGVYCDLIRFLFIKHNIMSGNTEREDIDDFLHATVICLKDEPSLMSSLGRRKETSTQKIRRSLACYDSPVEKQRQEVWSLIKDCEPLEDSLKPVYIEMENEKNKELLE